MEALLETLEFHNDWCEGFPLHGMASEVSAGHGSYEDQICIVLRAQSTHAHQHSADLKAIKCLHERFSLDNSGKVFDIRIYGTNKDVLEGATLALASYLPVKDVLEATESLVVADF
jgi:hypothetical protein